MSRASSTFLPSTLFIANDDGLFERNRLVPSNDYYSKLSFFPLGKNILILSHEEYK